MDKEGIHFNPNADIVTCDIDQERCHKRLYGPETPENVEVILPEEGMIKAVGMCSEVSTVEKPFVCSYQIAGIRIKPKK